MFSMPSLASNLSIMLVDQPKETFKLMQKQFPLTIVQLFTLNKKGGLSQKKKKWVYPEMELMSLWKPCNKWMTMFHLIWFLSIIIWSFPFLTMKWELVFIRRQLMNWLINNKKHKNSLQINMQIMLNFMLLSFMILMQCKFKCTLIKKLKIKNNASLFTYFKN